MKSNPRIALLIGIWLLSLVSVFGAKSSSSSSSSGTVQVKGYTRKDGTYVAPHTRTAPNSTKSDNWSTKGNVNPYTGAVGAKSDSPTAPSTSPAPKPSSATATTPAAAPKQSATIEIGMTEAKLRELKGPHNGVMIVGNVTVYSWPDVQVGLVDGKVQKILPR